MLMQARNDKVSLYGYQNEDSSKSQTHRYVEHREDFGCCDYRALCLPLPDIYFVLYMCIIPGTRPLGRWSCHITTSYPEALQHH
jgi:hypothetical protein